MDIINKRKKATQRLVLAAVMTALVIVLQLLGTFTAIFGPFATAVGLVPIIIGAAMCGVGVGGWLGLVFGVVVLLTNSAAFLGISFGGTIVTVLAKGILCGLGAGLVYKLLEGVNKYLAVLAAAITGTVVNTGVFTLGFYAFFLEKFQDPTVQQESGLFQAFINGNPSGNMTEFLFIFLIGTNFFVELATNIILAPVIVRLLDLRKRISKD